MEGVLDAAERFMDRSYTWKPEMSRFCHASENTMGGVEGNREGGQQNGDRVLMRAGRRGKDVYCSMVPVRLVGGTHAVNAAASILSLLFAVFAIHEFFVVAHGLI